MKKSTTFIITVVVTLLSIVNMVGSHSRAAVAEPDPIVASPEFIASNVAISASNTNNSKKTTTSTADPAYIIIAMYNGECYTLDCCNDLKTATSNLTVLPYPGKRCRDVDLMFVGPKAIKKINVIDKKGLYIANSKFTTHDKGVSHSHFVMDPELAAVVHDLEDGDHTYEFYLEIISTDGTVSYTSVWYK